MASISELSLLARTPGDAQAHLLDARTGELRAAARSTNTTVEAKELFFSVPARRATQGQPRLEAQRRWCSFTPFFIWQF